MSDLPEDLEALLRAARREEDPTDEDRRAVHGAVAARLLAAAAAGTTATLVTKTAVAAAKGSIITSVAAWVGAGIAIGGVVSIVAVVASADRPAPSAVAAVPTDVRVTAPVAPQPDPAPVASVAPRPAPAVARPAPSVPAARPPSLQQETQALADVQRALRDQNPEQALRLIEKQDRSFQGGALAEERAAAHILALCAAGRLTEAREAAGRFLAAHPSSPVAARVRASCAGK
jgi:hypothetical protein